MIRVVVGLGNPGEKYQSTRHNLGFMIIDNLQEKLKSSRDTRECYAHAFRARFCRHDLLFVKPMTYMNLSGKTIRCLMRKYNLLPEEILVIYDDVALPFGEVRIRERGSSGGHNGLESIIELIDSDNFPRIRIGILNPEVHDLVNYVLSEFDSEELENLPKLIDYSRDCFKSIICKGLTQAQKYFNKQNIFKT